ncbi:unnamed protein product [Paramecium sonneborni]|uniref:Uncharacterized protein n=1 Tax=Paramecium sonneborni TaxID=65129 RepID=A0A8S1RRT6_9CILI|nr:unnamed protein product [Paramecium sonneborni]
MDQKEDLYDTLALSKDQDQQIYRALIEIFRKENFSNFSKYLANDGNLQNYEQNISKVISLPFTNEQEELKMVKNKMMIMMNIMKQIKDHDFNQNDFFYKYLQRNKKRSDLKNIIR